MYINNTNIAIMMIAIDRIIKKSSLLRDLQAIELLGDASGSEDSPLVVELTRTVMGELGAQRDRVAHARLVVLELVAGHVRVVEARGREEHLKLENGRHRLKEPVHAEHAIVARQRYLKRVDDLVRIGVQNHISLYTP